MVDALKLRLLKRSTETLNAVGTGIRSLVVFSRPLVKGFLNGFPGSSRSAKVVEGVEEKLRFEGGL